MLVFFFFFLFSFWTTFFSESASYAHGKVWVTHTIVRGQPQVHTFGGFIKGILRGVRCTKSKRVLFLNRWPPSWTTLVLYSRAVFIFNEPAYFLVLQPPQYHKSQTSGIITVHIHVLYKGCLCHIVQYCLAQWQVFLSQVTCLWLVHLQATKQLAFDTRDGARKHGPFFMSRATFFPNRYKYLLIVKDTSA